MTTATRAAAIRKLDARCEALIKDAEADYDRLMYIAAEYGSTKEIGAMTLEAIERKERLRAKMAGCYGAL